MSNLTRLIAEKEIRDGKRYKQRQIADEVDLSPAMISRLLTDDKDFDNTTIKVARKLAKWLGCKVDDLFTVVEVTDDLLS